MEVEYKKTKEKTNRNVQFDYERGEIRLFGTRIALIDLVPACKRIDKMFGTGGEVIVNCMAFEQGCQLFEAMMATSPGKSKEELLNEVVSVQPLMGWGVTSLKIVSDSPPRIEVSVKNSPVKTLQGSLKHWMGAFWAGMLSKYFNQQLKCSNFSYDEKEDELSCIVAT